MVDRYRSPRERPILKRLTKIIDSCIASPLFSACPTSVGELPEEVASAAAAAIGTIRGIEGVLCLFAEAKHSDDPPLRPETGAILWWKTASMIPAARSRLLPVARFHRPGGPIVKMAGMSATSYHQFAVGISERELFAMVGFASLKLVGELESRRDIADQQHRRAITQTLVDSHHLIREYCRHPAQIRTRKAMRDIEHEIMLEARGAADRIAAQERTSRRRGILAGVREKLAREASRPLWNSQERTLVFRGQTLRKYRRAAASQFAILAAFEAEGWPGSILAEAIGTFGPGDLRSTVRDLNKGLVKVEDSIEFRHLESENAIAWEQSVDKSANSP